MDIEVVAIVYGHFEGYVVGGCLGLESSVLVRLLEHKAKVFREVALGGVNTEIDRVVDRDH